MRRRAFRHTPSSTPPATNYAIILGGLNLIDHNGLGCCTQLYRGFDPDPPPIPRAIASWTVRSVDLVEIYLVLTLHRAIHRGGRTVRPGLLGLIAILRSRTFQESTWVFLFGSKSPTLIYFHPRPAPVRHTYMCAWSQGNGDLDTSTTSLSLIFNQPLLSSLFTSVSLHTTFLLIK